MKKEVDDDEDDDDDGSGSGDEEEEEEKEKKVEKETKKEKEEKENYFTMTTVTNVRSLVQNHVATRGRTKEGRGRKGKIIHRASFPPPSSTPSTLFRPATRDRTGVSRVEEGGESYRLKYPSTVPPKSGGKRKGKKVVKEEEQKGGEKDGNKETKGRSKWNRVLSSNSENRKVVGEGGSWLEDRHNDHHKYRLFTDVAASKRSLLLNLSLIVGVVVAVLILLSILSYFLLTTPTACSLECPTKCSAKCPTKCPAKCPSTCPIFNLKRRKSKEAVVAAGGVNVSSVNTLVYCSNSPPPTHPAPVSRKVNTKEWFV